MQTESEQTPPLLIHLPLYPLPSHPLSLYPLYLSIYLSLFSFLFYFIPFIFFIQFSARNRTLAARFTKFMTFLTLIRGPCTDVYLLSRWCLKENHYGNKRQQIYIYRLFYPLSPLHCLTKGEKKEKKREENNQCALIQLGYK